MADIGLDAQVVAAPDLSVGPGLCGCDIWLVPQVAAAPDLSVSRTRFDVNDPQGNVPPFALGNVSLAMIGRAGISGSTAYEALHALGSVVLALSGRAGISGSTGLTVGLGDVTLPMAGRATVSGAIGTTITLGDVALAMAGRATLSGDPTILKPFDLGNVTLRMVGRAGIAGDLMALAPWEIGAITLAMAGRMGVSQDELLSRYPKEIGDLVLAISARMTAEWGASPFDPARIAPQQQSAGGGGPDGGPEADGFLPPRVKKWLEDRYKAAPPPTVPDAPKQEVRGTVRPHSPDKGGSTPPPATNTEKPDLAPLLEEATAALQAAVTAVTEAKAEADRQRVSAQRWRAVALTLPTLLDD